MGANWEPRHLKGQLDRAPGLVQLLIREAREAGLPPAFVLAIASRETGIRNILGDHGYGHGVMQIDIRFHRAVINANPDWREDPTGLVAHGCHLLASDRKKFSARSKGGTEAQLLKFAASAYNCGYTGAVHGFTQYGDSDHRTTGRDYGRDVLARMEVFAELLGGIHLARVVINGHELDLPGLRIEAETWIPLRAASERLGWTVIAAGGDAAVIEKPGRRADRRELPYRNERGTGYTTAGAFAQALDLSKEWDVTSRTVTFRS